MSSDSRPTPALGLSSILQNSRANLHVNAACGCPASLKKRQRASWKYPRAATYTWLDMRALRLARKVRHRQLLVPTHNHSCKGVTVFNQRAGKWSPAPQHKHPDNRLSRATLVSNITRVSGCPGAPGGSWGIVFPHTSTTQTTTWKGSSWVPSCENNCTCLQNSSIQTYLN